MVSRCECVQLWWSQVRWRYPPATPGQAPKIPVRVAEKRSPSPAVHSSPATHGPGPGPGDGGERADSDTAGCPQGPGPRRVRRRVGGTGESGPARLRERWTRRLTAAHGQAEGSRGLSRGGVLGAPRWVVGNDLADGHADPAPGTTAAVTRNSGLPARAA